MASRDLLLDLLAVADGPLPEELWAQLPTLDVRLARVQRIVGRYLQRNDVPAEVVARLDARWGELDVECAKGLWRHLPHRARLAHLVEPVSVTVKVATVMLSSSTPAEQLELFDAIAGDDATVPDRLRHPVADALAHMSANGALCDEVRVRAAVVALGRWLSGWAPNETVAASLTSAYLEALLGRRPGRDALFELLGPPATASDRQLQVWAAVAAPQWRHDGDADVFAEVARRVLSEGFDGKRSMWVDWVAAQVCENKSWLPAEVRAEFLAAAAEVDSERCSKAIRKLTHRPAPDRTAAGIRDALAELAERGSDRGLRARLAAAPARASVPAELVDDVVSNRAVDQELAWGYVDRFTPHADGVHLVGLRPGDAVWVAQVVRRDPTLGVLAAADRDTLAAAAPAIIDAYARESQLSGTGAPSERFFAELADVAGERLVELNLDVAVQFAQLVPAARHVVAARLVAAPLLALELADDFDGTLEEFSALLEVAAAS